jgi:hypothetical protein
MCISDVLEGDIEFTEPVCICEVPLHECDNLEVNGKIRYDEVVLARGKAELD